MTETYYRNQPEYRRAERKRMGWEMFWGAVGGAIGMLFMLWTWREVGHVFVQPCPQPTAAGWWWLVALRAVQVGWLTAHPTPAVLAWQKLMGRTMGVRID